MNQEEKQTKDADTNETTETMEEEVTKEESANKEGKLLTPSEQHMMHMLEEARSKPIPIPDNLRETLVKLQSYLEKNNSNPELLETVKQDLAFFDDVVMKHKASWRVCYKHKTNWGGRKQHHVCETRRASCRACSVRGPDQTRWLWACSWRWESMRSRA